MESVKRLDRNLEVVAQFNRRDLVVQFVKWEDTARSKNSCWGPNISDVSLAVGDDSYPIIGTKNYKDKTIDLPLGEFSVNVGNEVKEGQEKLVRLPLADYLKNLGQYVSFGVDGPMLLERDSSILTSTQCCVLPIEDGKSTAFSVRIHNYQYSATKPACLVVVSSPHGTSAQLLTESEQKIYFNRAGRRADYVAERVETRRKRENRPQEGPLNQQEKEDNVLFVYQIPLLVEKEKPRSKGGWDNEKKSDSWGWAKSGLLDSDDDDENNEMGIEESRSPKSRGMSHAQLSVGQGHSAWDEQKQLRVRRDPAFPIRCTIQYYRVSDCADIPSPMIDEIADQIWLFYKNAPP
jgi:hypothetical protein